MLAESRSPCCRAAFLQRTGIVTAAKKELGRFLSSVRKRLPPYCFLIPGLYMIGLELGVMFRAVDLPY